MYGNHVERLTMCLVFLVVSPALGGNVLYVDKNSPQANDSNPGTEALPWKTVDRAMAVVQPGDRVYVKGGTNAGDPQALYDRTAKNGLPIQRPGTADNKIVVEAYPGHVVVFQGDGTQYGIALDYASHYEIRGFLFRNFNKATEGTAAKIDILIEQCEFTITHTTGLRLRSITNLTLRDVNVHHCFEAGIYVIDSSHVRLERVTSSFNDDLLGASGDGDGIDTVAVDDFVCVDCTVEGNSEDGFDLNSSGSLLNCVSKNNTVCGVKLWRRSEDNYQPRKMTLSNCLVYGNGEAGIKASEAAALDLFHSVVYGNAEEGVAFRSATIVTAPAYSRIIDTISAGNGWNGIVAAGTTVNVVDASNNLYYRNGSANVGLHSDTQSLLGQDPLFVDPGSGSFQLRAASPAVDRGMVISGYDCTTAGDHPDQGLREWYGRAPEIGACEVALSAITDLSVSGTSQNSVSLAWTVPGDPLLMRKPTSYDIRYANSPLTDTTWAVATPVPNELTAGNFGQAQSFTVAGLSAASTYYLALRTTDERGNISWLSNVVSAATGAGTNHTPVLAPIGNKSINENQLLTFTISATDADGDPITYSATGLPAGATLNGPTFNWTPTYSQAGSYNVTFTASDGQAQSSQTITITVVNVDRPPVLGAIGPKSVIVGSLLSFTISATDPDGDSLTYSAGPLPGGATFTGQTFAWTPASTQAGSYTVTFTVSDGTLTDSESVVITVVGGSADQTAPTVARCSPAPKAIQVALNNLITLHVADAGAGVNPGSVVIRVDGSVVYQGNADAYTSPTGRCSRSGAGNDYQFIYQANVPFDFDQTVAVRVNAADVAGNVMSEYAYGFTTQMRTFGANQPVSALGGYADSKPVTASDPAGNLWVAWHAGAVGSRDIYIAKLPVGASAFLTPVRLTSDTRDQCNPDLAVSAAGAVYVVWQDNRNGNWDIYASISSDGASFSKNMRVTSSNRNEINPALAFDHQAPACVYVAWQDDRNGNQDIYVASSTNALATSTTARVTSNAADQTEPAVVVDSSNVAYIFWTDVRNGQADIYGAASSSAAGAWANVPVVTGSGAQTQPAATAGAGDALHLLWVDDSSGNKDIYYAALDGLPGSPVVGVNVVDDTSGADQAAPTIVGGTDQRIFACWIDWRHAGTGDTDTDLYMAELRAGKAGTNILVGDDGTNVNQSDPALGVDRYGQPYVVWTDYRNTTTEIYYAGTTQIDPNPLDSKAVVASLGGIVGTDPAAINGPEDVSVVVPAGACQADLRMTISNIVNPPVSALPLLGSYEFGPSGVIFNQPVTVTIPYAVSPNNRKALPYWYDSVTQALSENGITDVRNLSISPKLSALQFRTTHFTPFYVVEADAGGVPPDGSGSGGCALSRHDPHPALEFLLPYLGLAAVMVVLRLRDRRASMPA